MYLKDAEWMGFAVGSQKIYKNLIYLGGTKNDEFL